MENQSVDAMIASVKQMIEYCQDVFKLLQADEKFFSKQDVKSIEQSNQQKEILLDKLNSLTHGLSQHSLVNSAGNWLESVDQIDAEETKKTELRKIISYLKTEISKCYEHIVLNSNVISANMQFIRNIREGLLASQTEMETVYDNTGNKVK